MSAERVVVALLALIVLVLILRVRAVERRLWRVEHPARPRPVRRSIHDVLPGLLLLAVTAASVAAASTWAGDLV